jgi:hypothetical protein
MRPSSAMVFTENTAKRSSIVGTMGGVLGESIPGDPLGNAGFAKSAAILSIAVYLFDLCCCALSFLSDFLSGFSITKKSKIS